MKPFHLSNTIKVILIMLLFGASAFIVQNALSTQTSPLTLSTRAAENCKWEKKGEYCDGNKKEMYETEGKKCDGQWTGEERYNGTGRACGDWGGGEEGGCKWEEKQTYCGEDGKHRRIIAKKCDGNWTSEERHEFTGNDGACGGQPAPTSTPVPGPTTPVGIPEGKNCSYTGSGCVSATFYGTNANNPPEGKMWCCKNGVDGPDGKKWGTAEPCDPGACGGSCDRHPEGGVHSDTTCNNPYRCPVRTTPAPNQPTPTPGECKDNSKGFYCDTWSSGDNYCKRFETFVNSCNGAESYKSTGQNCCPEPGQPSEPPPPTSTPRPRTPNEPTPTTPPTTPKNPPGTCTQLTVTLEKGGSVNVNSLSANNVLPRVPAPGEKITVTSRTDGPSAFSGYWIRPVGSPDNYNPTAKDYDAASVCAFYIPAAATGTQTNGSTVTFTMPDWKSTPLYRNDAYGGTRNCSQYPINFDAGVIIGVNYLQPQGGWNGNQWCRNIGPGTGDGQLHNGSIKLGQACTSVCVAVGSPQAQPTPTTPPNQPSPTTPPNQPSPTTPPPTVPPQEATPTNTPTPQPQTCGYTPCDDQTQPCANGLICLETSTGAKYCSRPEYQQACYTSPSEQTCCAAPNRKLCGASQCDDILAPCENGLQCIETSVGVKYCTMPQYSQSCAANPSQPTCCTAPTATPTPTPRPVSCGERCDDSSVRCANGMICVNTTNGRYCSMPNFQGACAQNPSQITCCTEPSPTPQPTFTPQPTYTPQPTLPPQVAPPQQQIIRQQQAPPPNRVVQQVTVFIQPTQVPQAPLPTYTPLPTFTPLPTQQPQPTYTPPAIPVAGNPIPWVVVGTPMLLMLLGLFL